MIFFIQNRKLGPMDPDLYWVSDEPKTVRRIKMRKTLQPSCYLQFNEELCTGCTHCVRRCPTSAIRIRKRKSIRIVDHCIGCGECILACPTYALSAASSELDVKDQNHISVAIVSPVLYAQFPKINPKAVLRGLRKLGFHYTIDISYYIELFLRATEEYIRKNRTSRKSPWPLISPVCPVVIRLIAFQFPVLLSNILPILRPTTLAAREVRKKIRRICDANKQKIVLYHITPNRSSLPQEYACMDRIIGINDVYSGLMQQLGNQKQEIPTSSDKTGSRFFTSKNCIGWGASGGEIDGLDIDRSLAISGLRETITYLQKIELGLFRDIEYIEFRICPEGCVGGKHTSVDKYLAKNEISKMQALCSPGRSISQAKIIQLYEDGWFLNNFDFAEPKRIIEHPKEPLTLESLQKIDDLLEKIQGMDCGACGAPNCRIFAEDVVRGDASLEECLVFRMRQENNDN
jgi:Na+-translocating ferredoxin:NAD+ oxidoreductase RNF subunit RnfB